MTVRNGRIRDKTHGNYAEFAYYCLRISNRLYVTVHDFVRVQLWQGIEGIFSPFPSFPLPSPPLPSPPLPSLLLYCLHYFLYSLSTAYCLLSTAYCLLPILHILPTAYSTAYCHAYCMPSTSMPTAYCLLTAYCLYCIYCLRVLPTAYSTAACHAYCMPSTA